MTHTVVVGGGFAGMATAVRLAKLNHQVTLVSPELGGALNPFEADGFSWDIASTTLLPAVTRDLFRKSGRPLERELELLHVDILREHRWADGTALRVPGTSRAAQVAELGREWVDHVSTYGPIWEETRHYLFERRGPVLPRHVEKILADRTSLARRLRTDFSDKALRTVAAHPFELAGHQLRDVPAWAGLTAYLEQRFGGWRPSGGMAELRDALVGRLATRKVNVVTEIAHDVTVRAGRAVAVTTSAGEIEADHIVVAIDPRVLPALAPLVRRTTPLIPPTVAHIGLAATAPQLTHELVLHGSPDITVRPHSRGPEGTSAWTLLLRDPIAGPVAPMLRRRGLAVADTDIVAQHVRTPAQLLTQWRNAPGGVAWQGRRTTLRQLGPTTEIERLYVAGAASISGDGLPFAGLSAALVAAAIGPTERA